MASCGTVDTSERMSRALSLKALQWLTPGKRGEAAVAETLKGMRPLPYQLQ